MFAFIVIALLVCVVAVLLVWVLSPAYRKRMEEPKHRFLALQKKYTEETSEASPEQPLDLSHK